VDIDFSKEVDSTCKRLIVHEIDILFSVQRIAFPLAGTFATENCSLAAKSAHILGRRDQTSTVTNGREAEATLSTGLFFERPAAPTMTVIPTGSQLQNTNNNIK
jgi:hypothetical protein